MSNPRICSHLYLDTRTLTCACGARWAPVKIPSIGGMVYGGDHGTPPTAAKPRPEDDYYTKDRKHRRGSVG